jgi:SAM-dependent methyltransferase
MTAPEAEMPPAEGHDAGDTAAAAYWDRRLDEHWGPHGVGCLVYGRRYNSWLYKIRRAVFERILRRFDIHPAEAAVLDIGCGTGFYIEQWRKAGVGALTGLDIAEVSVRRLGRQYRDVAFLRWDISEGPLPLAPSTFDVVSAFDVLFHIVNNDAYRRALENIHAVLKRDGYLFYSDTFLHWGEKTYSSYWKGRTLASVEEVLHECGFRVVARLPMFVLMNAPVDSRSPRVERLWERAMWPVRRSEAVGFLVGAALYPLERFLVSRVRESPTTEVMICRKR